MAQIQQQSDGTYVKSYSDTEVAIIQQLQMEMDTRAKADDNLYILIMQVTNRVGVLEAEQFSLAEIQNSLNLVATRMELAESRLDNLEKAVVVDAYSRDEIDSLLVPWRLEEINKVFETPTNQMFEEADLKDIRTGFVHYPGGSIMDTYGLQFQPNTMRRYSLMAYTSVVVDVQFLIYYADQLVVYLNDEEVITYQEEGGNFNGTQKSLSVSLKAGWNKIAFLVANETQQGGLVVTSDLMQKVERLSALGTLSGKITGEQIQPGSLDEDHFSPNMDIIIKKIHATTTDGAAGIFGDPETYGAIQIADALFSKTKGEPFTLYGDLKVMGYVRDKDGNLLGNSGSGLSTADREKLDSIAWNAEVNQPAFSYVKLFDLPVTEENPFANILNATLKMDTLQIRGDLGITFDIEEIEDEDGNPAQQMVIKNSPTEFKEALFISEEGQDTFTIDPAEGSFQIGRGTVQLYIDGVRQSGANFYEVDEHTLHVNEHLSAGLNVLIVWQEGSPQFAKETIVSLANLPIATRVQDGLMSRHHVEDLYDHKHTMADITDRSMYNKLLVDDGETVHTFSAPSGSDGTLRFKAGKNIKMEKLNDTVRISSTGPKLTGGRLITITGSAEEGYSIENTQQLEAGRGLTLEHIDGIDVISGPRFVDDGGINIRTLDDVTYALMNTMSMVSLGGLIIEGNAAEGYRLINDLTIEPDSRGGLDVIGSPVKGYVLRNTMLITGKGISVAGNASVGYELQNTATLTAGDGMLVQGDIDEGYTVINDLSLEVDPRGGLILQGSPRRGYKLTNSMTLQGDGITVEGNASEGFTLRNKATIIEGGGIQVTGDINAGYKIMNDLQIQAATKGSVTVTGTPTGGYTITGLWPAIAGSTGIAVDNHGDGTYTVRNEGVTSYNGQTGQVIGVGTLNKVQEGLGIEVSFLGGGDYVVHNTGVVFLVDDGRGIDVEEQAQGVWRIRNIGVIGVRQGAGISVSDDGQGVVTVNNTGIHKVHQGNGINVSQAGNDVTITNTGVLGVIEGEGIDVASGNNGTVIVRNSGVHSWNGQTGDVNFVLPYIPKKTLMSVATFYEFAETAQSYIGWMRGSQSSTTHYCYGVKEPDMAYFNVTVMVAVASAGQEAEVILYTGTPSNVQDSYKFDTVRNVMEGQMVTLSSPIHNITDFKLTGVHVGMRAVEGEAFIRVMRAWLSDREGSNADYQV